MENLAEIFLALSKEDLSIIGSIETGMRDYEWVPLPEISRLSDISPRKVEYRLRILCQAKLVIKTTIHYEGYQIDFDAYDLLALSDLVERNFVRCIGEKVGVGKESIVFDALSVGEDPLAIKFHRQGRTSFKHVRRARDHLKDMPRVPWLYAASLAAHHEFQVMKRLYPDVSIPKPVAISRHALVMEFLSGDQLNRVILSDPQECLEIILGEVRKTYEKGIIHADLSEFNVIVTEDDLRIIDWPQAIDIKHQNAAELLERDISNILRFFKRRYRINMPLEDALSEVLAAGKEAV